MKIRLADMSVRRPIGILENVNVRIGRFSFPTYFLVIDMVEDLDAPIILGRPFLNMAKVPIDVFSKTIAFKSGKETLTFILKPSYSEEEQLCSISSPSMIPVPSELPTTSESQETVDIEIDVIFSSPIPPYLNEVMELSDNSSIIFYDLTFKDIPIDELFIPDPQIPEELFTPMTDIDDMISFIEMFKDHPAVIAEVIQKSPINYIVPISELANDIEREIDPELLIARIQDFYNALKSFMQASLDSEESPTLVY